jgi:hypothetical protein
MVFVLCHVGGNGTESGLRSPAEMRKLLGRLSSKTGYVLSVTRNSLTTTTSCQITKSLKGWQEHGETTIQTIFKQHTGGATEKRDQLAWVTDGPIIRSRSFSVCP